MLKKKRFSGLFGAGLTDIPSPGPEQQQQQQQQQTETASHSVSRGFSPQMLSNQGRQSSMTTLSTTSGIMGGFGQNNKNDESSNSTRASDEANTLTRAEVHQSLENLKKLVIAAESYRELTSKLAKTTKQLGKCFKEYGDTKGMDSTYGKLEKRQIQIRFRFKFKGHGMNHEVEVYPDHSFFSSTPVISCCPIILLCYPHYHPPCFYTLHWLLLLCCIVLRTSEHNSGWTDNYGTVH